MQDPVQPSVAMTALTPQQEEPCSQSRWDFSDLRAVFINCTLKRSPEVSHTQGLADRSIEIMRRQSVMQQARLTHSLVIEGIEARLQPAVSGGTASDGDLEVILDHRSMVGHPDLWARRVGVGALSNSSGAVAGQTQT